MPNPLVATIGQGVVGLSQAHSAGKRADRMASKQGAIADQQMEWSKEDRAYYEEHYRPLEEKMLENLDVDVNQRVGEAITTTEQQFAGAEAARRRNLGRMGINPNSGRYQGMERSAALDRSIARTNSGNMARNLARAEETSNIGNALNFGRGGMNAIGGMMNNASSVYSDIGTQYGNAAANSMKFAMQAPNTTNEWMKAWKPTPAASAPNTSGPITHRDEITYSEGGPVIGQGGPKDDAIPARLSNGEYVIPADVVARKGTEFFDKLLKGGAK